MLARARMLKKHPTVWLLAIACFLTCLNAVKPMTIDDTAYYDVASQVARSPLDPYGFAIHWYRTPLPANHVVAPPVVVYWWALGIRLLGDRPAAWKMWMLPSALLLVFGLHGLYRRFATGIEVPLVCFSALSPAFLPGFNMMLDVPAVGLGLAGLNLFAAGCERSSWKLAGAAGLVLGLSLQTKYTAFTFLGAAGLYSLLRHRIRLGLTSFSVALLMFVGWEAFIAGRYGESHFLRQLLHGYPFPVVERADLVRPFFVYLGGLSPGLLLLACVIAGARRPVIAALAVLVAVPYLTLAWMPAPVMDWVARAGLAEAHHSLNRRLLGMLGLMVGSSVLGVAAWRGRRHWARRGKGWELGRGLRADLFLGLWLALELAAYFYVSPFAAARRVMGITVVTTAWLGRYASSRCRRDRGYWSVFLIAGGHALLGAGFSAVDWLEAKAERSGVVQAMERIRSADEAPTVWYVGRWGFQFYARRMGMKPVVPKYEPPPSYTPLPAPSLLRPGDWLVVPDSHIEQQDIALDGPLALEASIEIDDPVPLRTVRCYYAGYTPIEHREGPRLRVDLFRVKRDFVPN